MNIWIPITIAAAFAQNLRFMLQKHLKATELSTAGATFSRFLYSAPLVALLLIVYLRLSETPMPDPNARFWFMALTGGLGQILATMCVVAIFSYRSFAVGITFKKTEVLQTALLGFVVLGEGISAWGLGAILIGFTGVILLSKAPGDNDRNWIERMFTPAAGLGLLSGILFACSAIGYRGASLSLGLDVPFFARSCFTLAVVTSSQTVAMAIWLYFRESGEITRVLRSWRVSGLVGLTSMAGSLGWFTAFTLQNAAYVKALGQIELLFSFIASTVFFKEEAATREIVAMLLLTGSILLLVLLA
ncbi:DMT family transporter [Halocynthiibacter sp. C4]|uniref:DMT family transporter n=1 Tax=Halocynthiibacter sp. C4 TaxID=2992758 RepID=UPI00237B9AFD|nr:DMT family transporter [Halocynthiibacter sp. C4]MDE0588985.1 DMT family transporter [Halocynthiibacter sp. C4]